MFGTLMSISFIIATAWIIDEVWKRPLEINEYDEDY